ncbi:MAG: hypothetical protein JW882_20835 [Deltaproteobacteria bacterium]|nr:hypothetical protein [Deltaproteobacteria bacterium]
MKNLKNLNPSDYWKILLRRKWYALGAFFIVSCGFIAYSLYTPDVFRSTAMLQVETAPIPRDYVRPSDMSTPREQIAAVNQLIQSRSFLERLIQEFQISGYGANEDFVMDNAVRSVRKNVQVESTSHNTFTISYVSIDPQLAQSFTERIVELLIQTSSSSRKGRALETDQFLDDQLRQTQQYLADQEEKIKQFKLDHLGWLPEQRPENMNALSALKRQLMDIEEKLQDALNQKKLMEASAIQQEQINFMTQSLMPTESLLGNYEEGGDKETDPDLAEKEAQLDELSSRYTPNHPDVIQIAKEVGDIKKRLAKKSIGDAMPDDTQFLGMDGTSVEAENENPVPEMDGTANIESAGINFEQELIQNTIAGIEKKKEAIQSEIRLYEEKLKLAPQVEQELSALLRDRDLLERQYRSLKDDKLQAQMTANLENTKNSDTYEVIDPANLPENPVFPDRTQIAFMGFGLAVAMSIGAAFGRELLDSTLSTEEEAVKVLKLPVLVSIYEISKKKAGKSRKMPTAKSA